MGVAVGDGQAEVIGELLDPFGGDSLRASLLLDILRRFLYILPTSVEVLSGSYPRNPSSKRRYFFVKKLSLLAISLLMTSMRLGCL